MEAAREHLHFSEDIILKQNEALVIYKKSLAYHITFITFGGQYKTMVDAETGVIIWSKDTTKYFSYNDGSVKATGVTSNNKSVPVRLYQNGGLYYLAYSMPDISEGDGIQSSIFQESQTVYDLLLNFNNNESFSAWNANNTIPYNEQDRVRTAHLS